MRRNDTGISFIDDDMTDKYHDEWRAWGEQELAYAIMVYGGRLPFIEVDPSYDETFHDHVSEIAEEIWLPVYLAKGDRMSRRDYVAIAIETNDRLAEQASGSS